MTRPVCTCLADRSSCSFDLRVGNVPQLAVDIIISTLPDLKRVGFLNSSDLVPFVGGQERGEGGIVTALEVYAQEDSDVFWIQQRSPVLKVSSRSKVALRLGDCSAMCDALRSTRSSAAGPTTRTRLAPAWIPRHLNFLLLSLPASD